MDTSRKKELECNICKAKFTDIHFKVLWALLTKERSHLIVIFVIFFAKTSFNFLGALLTKERSHLNVMFALQSFQPKVT